MKCWSRIRWWSALAALCAGCLPLDAELPAVDPFPVAPDVGVDAAPVSDASPVDDVSRADTIVDMAPPDVADTAPAPPDAAYDAAPDAEGAVDGGTDPDVGAGRCEDGAVVPGAGRVLVGPRWTLDPTARVAQCAGSEAIPDRVDRHWYLANADRIVSRGGKLVLKQRA